MRKSVTNNTNAVKKYPSPPPTPYLIRFPTNDTTIIPNTGTDDASPCC